MSASTASARADAAAAPQVPPLRRLPVPVAEPPYDDEVVGRCVSGSAGTPAEDVLQGTLALAFVLPSGVPATPQAPLPGARRLALVGRGDDADEELAGPDDGDGEPDDADFGRRATPREQLPEPRGWAARLVQALVEVQAGDRPVSQLVRWTNEEVYATVARRVRLCGSAGGQRRSGARAVVRSVHVCEPVDGVAEACALVQRGARATAVALRMEGVDGRWQCTALEIG